MVCCLCIRGDDKNLWSSLLLDRPTPLNLMKGTRDLSLKSWNLLCGHPEDDGCECALAPGPMGVAQRLDEMEFSRSACAAAQQGNVAKLQRLLARSPDEVHNDGTGGSSGYTPLHYAARAGHLAAVQLLLKHGACVDASTRSGQSTALHRAAAQGHVDVVKTLLAAGSDATKQDSDGETALHKASAAGHVAVCALLMESHPGAAALLDKHGKTAQARAKDATVHALFAPPTG